MIYDIDLYKDNVNVGEITGIEFETKEHAEQFCKKLAPTITEYILWDVTKEAS